MFQLDPARTFLQVHPEQIAALYQSVNTTSVLLPGQPSAQARAVVVGYRTGPHAFGVAIALHLLESGRHLVYSHADGALDSEGARETAKEAIGFAESMGFFVESVSWKRLDPVAQRELLAQLRVFQPPPESAAPKEERKVVDPRLKLARLLVQF